MQSALVGSWGYDHGGSDTPSSPGSTLDREDGPQEFHGPTSSSTGCLPHNINMHNGGFYGHYRGQFKSESAGEYRLAAKPQPPTVFLKRCQEPARQHLFSKHDNRTSFDKGIGRRKDLERLWQRHTFLRWAPCELQLSRQQPLESSYQANFQSCPGPSNLPQRLVHFVQVQPTRASTTYQQNFGHPSCGGHYSSNHVEPQAPITNTHTLPNLPGTPRPKLLQHYLHAGVSECLNWSSALNMNG